MAVILSEFEKVIQEKTFYKVLMSEFINTESLGVEGHGFWITDNTYGIEIMINQELSTKSCKDLANGIYKKYNIFVPKNAREEKPSWSLSRSGNLWSFKVFINSLHKSRLLENKDFQKMLSDDLHITVTTDFFLIFRFRKMTSIISLFLLTGILLLAFSVLSIMCYMLKTWPGEEHNIEMHNFPKPPPPP